MDLENKIKNILNIIERSKLEEEKSLENIAKQILACKRCEFAFRRNNPLPGEFPSKAQKILFVADGPQYQDDALNKPMIGTHGEIFTGMIKQVLGLKRGEYNISYVLKCIPARPEGRIKPTGTAIFWCLEYLFRQIEVINPQIIVGMGFVPFYTFLYRKNEQYALKERASIANHIGKLYKTRMLYTGMEIPFFLMFDPRYWNLKKHFPDVVKQLKFLRKIIDDIYAERSIEHLYSEFHDPVYEVRQKQRRAILSRKERDKQTNS